MPVYRSLVVGRGQLVFSKSVSIPNTAAIFQIDGSFRVPYMRKRLLRDVTLQLHPLTPQNSDFRSRFYVTAFDLIWIWGGYAMTFYNGLILGLDPHHHHYHHLYSSTLSKRTETTRSSWILGKK